MTVRFGYLVPNVAGTMARVFQPVKSRQKKSGPISPDATNSIVWKELTPSCPVLRGQLRLGRYTRTHWLGFFDRTVPHRQTDQEDRHRPAGEQGRISWRIVALPAQRARRSRGKESDDGTDLPSRRPGRRSWHESIEAKAHDPANLKDHYPDFEDAQRLAGKLMTIPQAPSPWFLRGTREDGSPKSEHWSRELLLQVGLEQSLEPVHLGAHPGPTLKESPEKPEPRYIKRKT